MKIKVMCSFCNVKFMWDLEKTKEICPGCQKRLKIKDTKMTGYNYNLYVKYQKEKIGSKELFEPKITDSKRYEKQNPRTLNSRNTIQPEHFHISRQMLGKYIVVKNKSRHGTVELTNPDYMILKVNLWCMGEKQKQSLLELNNIIKKYLIEHEFTLTRK